uniref:Uncharacterized protein n=1 Tax=Rhizophora mucronata TaxID=61149 RepID=A0A2P2R366_RHIMU
MPKNANRRRTLCIVRNPIMGKTRKPFS